MTTHDYFNKISAATAEPAWTGVVGRVGGAMDVGPIRFPECDGYTAAALADLTSRTATYRAECEGLGPVFGCAYWFAADPYGRAWRTVADKYAPEHSADPAGVIRWAGRKVDTVTAGDAPNVSDLWTRPRDECEARGLYIDGRPACIDNGNGPLRVLVTSTGSRVHVRADFLEALAWIAGKPRGTQTAELVAHVDAGTPTLKPVRLYVRATVRPDAIYRDNGKGGRELYQAPDRIETTPVGLIMPVRVG